MTHRLPSHIVDRLNSAIESASLKNAGFGSDHVITVTEHWDGAQPKEYASVTEFVREKVRLHHGSWIISPLEAILGWSLSTDDGSMAEYDILGRLRAPFPNPKVLEEAHTEISRLRQENAALTSFRRAVEGSVKDLGVAIEDSKS